MLPAVDSQFTMQLINSLKMATCSILIYPKQWCANYKEHGTFMLAAKNKNQELYQMGD